MPCGPSLFQGHQIPNNSAEIIRNTDIIALSYESSTWVQNQSLIINFAEVIGISSNPSTPYPFKRLAYANDTSANAHYFYHQLDNGILAEDAYYYTNGWHTTNISVDTSGG